MALDEPISSTPQAAAMFSALFICVPFAGGRHKRSSARPMSNPISHRPRPRAVTAGRHSDHVEIILEWTS